jgi:hypothetical protein
MSDSSSPRDTWYTLLCDLQSSLADLDLFVPIPNENHFQQSLLKVCRKLHEGDHQRLQGIFVRHHAKIIAFVGDLDDSLGLPEPPGLGSLCWSVAFSVLKVSERKFLGRANLLDEPDEGLGGIRTSQQTSGFGEASPPSQQDPPSVRGRLVALPGRSFRPKPSPTTLSRVY